MTLSLAYSTPDSSHPPLLYAVIDCLLVGTTQFGGLLLSTWLPIIIKALVNIRVNSTCTIGDAEKSTFDADLPDLGGGIADDCEYLSYYELATKYSKRDFSSEDAAHAPRTSLH